MRRKRLFWQLFPSYTALILISLIAVIWFASYSFNSFFIKQSKQDLISRLRQAESRFIYLLETQNESSLDSLAKDLGRYSGVRITVVDASGKVLGDTDENPDSMDNHSDRPEIIEAQSEGSGSGIRYSHTLGEDMLYVAIPLIKSKYNYGSLRMAVPITDINTELKSIDLKIILGGVIIAIIGALISLGICRRISLPIEEIRKGAERIASGDFSKKLHVYDSYELGALAESMNKMAAELDNRIRTIISQRNEQEAVLASMVEGVLAIDTNECVISYNKAAADLLGIEPESACGRTIHEAVRNIDLQRFVSKVLKSMESSEEEIMLRDGGEKYIQVHGTVLRDSRGRGIGALVVLNDVTRLHRLESIRKEFVANVSHELKTPVTSIKGFVETLLDGAMNDPESARKFLEVISRQADRLNSIIEDLLTLSRMEQDPNRTQISLRIDAVKPVLKTAIQVCELKARESKIRILLSCPDDLKAKINGPLLEQAIINLLDNAIKYSEPESVIAIGADIEEGGIIIKVTDKGSGISREHLPRLFERFYLVDKARSRKLGGTGLGLAIVKHISQAHGGYPEVQSTPGKGSTFSIHLPAVE